MRLTYSRKLVILLRVDIMSNSVDNLARHLLVGLVLKSATSGKAGGLRERETLKAVIGYREALKVPSSPVVRGVGLFFLVLSITAHGSLVLADR
jgi:hypothetical protein